MAFSGELVFFCSFRSLLGSIRPFGVAEGGGWRSLESRSRSSSSSSSTPLIHFYHIFGVLEGILEVVEDNGEKFVEQQQSQH